MGNAVSLQYLISIFLMTINSFTATAYSETQKFKKIVTDYINGHNGLNGLFQFNHNEDGLKKAVEARTFNTEQRSILVDGLLVQYKSAPNNEKAISQISKLKNENCFTVCTAHQPNIFTGYWYTIYKICHTIALCNHLQAKFPTKQFVPVFYMGSEDADLEELGSLYFNEQQFNWATNQSGAVGRMKVDESLLQIKETIIAQTSHLPNAQSLITFLNNCYTKGQSIAQASFLFLHQVFEAYGLLVLIPDNAHWKKTMQPIYQQEITQNKSEALVIEASKILEENGYKPQAHARPINIFYLDDNSRSVITKIGNQYAIKDVLYSEVQILDMLTNSPEAFSPNVILRGILQETILPNVAFIGGGGEIAYWLQLKGVFGLYNVPFPMLLLRNSFSLITIKQWEQLEKVGLKKEQLFDSILELKNNISKSVYGNLLELHDEMEIINNAYTTIKNKTAEVDITLQIHTDALHVKHIHKIEVLQKKLVKAAREKLATKNKGLDKVFGNLYPNNGLQERKGNFLHTYAIMGDALIDSIIKNSQPIATHLNTLLVTP
jgi:bacillithiol synthase